MSIPHTKKDSIVDTIHDIKIADPYRWLENSEDPDVKVWTQSQNKHTEEKLHGTAFSVFSKELVDNFKSVTFSNPLPIAGRYFYAERQPEENQSALYMKKGLDGDPVTLVNPNKTGKNDTASIDFWNVSHDGRYIVYGLSEGGDEMARIFIKNTDTNENLLDVMGFARHASTFWSRDNAGFFYTRSPQPGTVPENEKHLHNKLYYHKLGTDGVDDPLIFGEGRPKDDSIGLSMSVDGTYLAIHTSQSWTKGDIHIYNTLTGQTTPFVVGVPAKFALRFLKDKVLLDTNHNADNYKMLWAPLDNFMKPFTEWEEFIPEREWVTDSVAVTKDKILIEYFVNACSEVVIFDHSGKEISKLPLPPCSSLSGISANKEEEEFFYGVESFTFPRVTYRFDPEKKDYVLFRKMENVITPKDYEVEQVWYVSKDSVRVPMFVMYKKGVVKDGTNPTVLYGYGGFGSSELPGFLKSWVPWLERGGIFAIANIRGGGEFGTKWHAAGIKEKKQNSYDDFIAAAEFLISEKYTSPAHVGISGGSNGGLLVAAVMMQRPELFGAVHSAVPLTDMVRFSQFGIAIRWVHEYGDPQVKEELVNILKWSPYHNITPGVLYPPALFKTAENDSRVHPMHACKMVAALQDVQTTSEKDNILLFVQTDAGHGMGKPVYKYVEGQALTLAFFARYLGLSL